ncbi:MAG: TetR family transcriptional regulator [Micropruina sp.]|uniref:TetR/AcrR family transcriptional regulator n=1 Tax=Micropruina sp. TaxID=2737536 RepID=UPI0039E343A7
MTRPDPTPARRGRPPRLTREAIARTVLEVGFPRLTFAAVRERLGVGETTLFRYAKDRDELVRLALDYAIEQVAWPPLTGPWDEVIEAYALAAWHAWERHPGAATEAARGIVPFGMMRLTDDLCAMLIRQGFSVENAVLACDLVFDLVSDNRRGVEHFDAVVPAAGPGREHLHGLWTDAPLPEPAEHAATPAERERIHAAIQAAIDAAPLDWFTGKLGIVMDGIRHTLAPDGHARPRSAQGQDGPVERPEDESDHGRDAEAEREQAGAGT